MSQNNGLVFWVHHMLNTKYSWEPHVSLTFSVALIITLTLLLVVGAIKLNRVLFRKIIRADSLYLKYGESLLDFLLSRFTAPRRLPRMDPEEASEYRWVRLSELKQEVLLKPDTFTSWFLIAISKVLPVIEQENALKYQEAQEKQRVGETTPESEA